MKYAPSSVKICADLWFNKSLWLSGAEATPLSVKIGEILGRKYKGESIFQTVRWHKNR